VIADAEDEIMRVVICRHIEPSRSQKTIVAEIRMNELPFPKNCEVGRQAIAHPQLHVQSYICARARTAIRVPCNAGKEHSESHSSVRLERLTSYREPIPLEKRRKIFTRELTVQLVCGFGA